MFKRFITLALIASTLTPLLASANDNADANTKIIFCPDKVVCKNAHDLTSCTYDTEHPQFWNLLKTNSSNGDSNAEAGEYKFNYVLSGYHEENRLVSTICRYSNGLNGDGNEISLLANEYSGLEAFQDTNTNWLPADPNMAQGVQCKSQDKELCPMKQISGFGVVYKKNNENSHLDYYLELWANGVALSGLETSITNDRYYRLIRYNDLYTCWNQKNCKIDIMLKSDAHDTVKVGSVTVDMDNKLKINEYVLSNNNSVTATVLNELNVIDIKTTESNLDNLGVSIENLTNLKGIHPLIKNASVVCRSAGLNKCVIHYYNAKQSCVDTPLCKIDLILNPNDPNPASVGYFIVNLENNMNIVDVQATRKNFIDVVRTEDNNIKIINTDFNLN